ncbi:hypothetical protein FLM9_706 [Candidatus Synechococcus spongiarum]|uniref:Uncharacterized protein n=1 Tax=Candidatus Synechococcus spongiarum TaxID=431041 RepID=A0A161KA91_9SYNE|nr:hypothetical protein FLM9_706 [Candidatus Synechococcus spongiarum]
MDAELGIHSMDLRGAEGERIKSSAQSRSHPDRPWLATEH